MLMTCLKWFLMFLEESNRPKPSSTSLTSWICRSVFFTFFKNFHLLLCFFVSICVSMRVSVCFYGVFLSVCMFTYNNYNQLFMWPRNLCVLAKKGNLNVQRKKDANPGQWFGALNYTCSAQNNQNAMIRHFGRPFSVFDITEQELYMNCGKIDTNVIVHVQPWALTPPPVQPNR